MKTRFFAATVLLILTGVLGRAENSAAPAGFVAQQIVCRVYAEINPATGSPTGRNTAAVYLPYLFGIPDQFLFSSKTVRDQTTAHFTAVFSPFDITYSVPNGDILNEWFGEGHEVRFYYDEHPNRSWNNFDGFTRGTHIATLLTQRAMTESIGDQTIIIASSDLIQSKEFTLPDGRKYDFGKLIPGGITVHSFRSHKFITNPGNPAIPMIVPVSQFGGRPAVMFPFTAYGIHNSKH